MPNGTIKFHNFDISQGNVRFQAYSVLDGVRQTDDLYYSFSENFIPGNNLIAIALAILCGKNYDSIYIDLNVDKDTLARVKEFTLADVNVAGYDCPAMETEGKNNFALSFSGGFDSLTAYYLMPEDTKLVSIDFGSKFKREVDFFSNFDTHIVATNFRKLGHVRLRGFMGFGAILYSEYLHIGYHAYGSIFETAPVSMLNDLNEIPALIPINWKDVTAYLLGITQAGTALIATHYAPDIIKDSLTSLSNLGSEKLLRKKLLIDIISERYGRDLKIGDEINEKPIQDKYKHIFGSRFSHDFIYLYILKHRGADIVSKVVRDMPEEAVAFTERLTMDFYEKLNPAFLEGVPEADREQYLGRLRQAGVTEFSDDDWVEFYAVREFLSRYSKDLIPVLVRGGIMGDPKISVIIPFYNADLYLRQLLNAVSCQIMRDIEIICINDGSDDDSYKILMDCAKGDSRFRIFNQENKGFETAKNAGIAAATGDYILMMDGINILDSAALGTLYHQASSEGLDILSFNGRIFSGTDDKTSEHGDGAFGCPVMHFIKRECLQDGDIHSYDEFLSVSLDTKLYKRKDWDRVFYDSLTEDRMKSYVSKVQAGPYDTIARLERELRLLKARQNRMLSSRSYRLGRAMTLPFRAFKGLLKKKLTCKE